MRFSRARPEVDPPHSHFAERAADLAHASPFSLGGLRFEPSTRQLFVNGASETLEPRVMQVLVLLAARRGQVVSRDELVEQCWQGRAVSEDAINRAVAKVRRIADLHGGFDLETIPRVGYRLGETWPDGASLGGRRRDRRWTAAALSLLLVIAIGSTLWLTALRPGDGAAEPVAVAVLPFRNLSPGDDHFSEGVAEEILTRLAGQPGLKVVGRTSSWMFRDRGDASEVGRRLAVSYILEGSVRRERDRVRVDVALVDTGDGMRRWSQRFEGGPEDIFAIQDQIGNAVAGSLTQQIVFSIPGKAPPRTRGDVYNMYLLARSLVRTREPGKVAAAIDLLQGAVQLDPAYAPAWAALGRATFLGMQNTRVSPDEMNARTVEARGYVERALQLAPQLAEAHMALWLVEPTRPGARARLERAVALEPTNSEYWYALANVRAAELDFEGAFAAYRRTAEIDPFWVRSSAYATHAWQIGRRQEALAFEQRLMRDHPVPVERLLARTRVALYQRDWSEAYRLSGEADRIRPAEVRAASGPFLGDPVYLRVRLGKLEEVERLMGVPWMIRLIRGDAPDITLVRQASAGGEAFWRRAPMNYAVSFRLLQHGRGADLLALYDQAFSSPEAMVGAMPPLDFVSHAPAVIVALRRAGRDQEAQRLLAHGHRLVTPPISRPEPPRDILERAARIRALQGRREEAIALLERAVALGWQFDQFGMVPRLADDPVYGSIHDDPRLRRLDEHIQAAVAKERAEAAALKV